MYADVARAPNQHFHFSAGLRAALDMGYPEDKLDALADAVLASFAGVGYPFRGNASQTGDTVLDIGAGSGTDSILANGLVSESGKAGSFQIAAESGSRTRSRR